MSVVAALFLAAVMCLVGSRVAVGPKDRSNLILCGLFLSFVALPVAWGLS